MPGGSVAEQVDAEGRDDDEVEVGVFGLEGLGDRRVGVDTPAGGMTKEFPGDVTRGSVDAH